MENNEMNQNNLEQNNMNQTNYQTPGNMNNNKSNSGLMVIIIILLLVVIGLLLYIFVFNNGDKNKPNNNNQSSTNVNEPVEDNKNESNEQSTSNQTINQEIEVPKNDYKYLLERLEKTFAYFEISDYLNLENMPDAVKINTAIAGLKVENLNFKSTDSFDVSNGFNISSLYEEFKNGYDGYSATNVENEVKKIYGKNTVVKHKADGALAYDKTIKAYLIIPSDLGNMPAIVQNINKITKLNNNIYIYVIVGLDDQIGEEVCYDINCNNSVKKSSIDKKYYNYGENKILNIEQYMKDNKDKFEQYKYTFEKEENNYIIKKLEKIN